MDTIDASLPALLLYNQFVAVAVRVGIKQAFTALESDNGEIQADLRTKDVVRRNLPTIGEFTYPYPRFAVQSRLGSHLISCHHPALHTLYSLPDLRAFLQNQHFQSKGVGTTFQLLSVLIRHP